MKIVVLWCVFFFLFFHPSVRGVKGSLVFGRNSACLCFLWAHSQLAVGFINLFVELSFDFVV